MLAFAACLPDSFFALDDKGKPPDDRYWSRLAQTLERRAQRRQLPDTTEARAVVEPPAVVPVTRLADEPTRPLTDAIMASVTTDRRMCDDMRANGSHAIYQSGSGSRHPASRLIRQANGKLRVEWFWSDTRRAGRTGHLRRGTDHTPLDAAIDSGADVDMVSGIASAVARESATIADYRPTLDREDIAGQWLAVFPFTLLWRLPMGSHEAHSGLPVVGSAPGWKMPVCVAPRATQGEMPIGHNRPLFVTGDYSQPVNTPYLTSASRADATRRCIAALAEFLTLIARLQSSASVADVVASGIEGASRRLAAMGS